MNSEQWRNLLPQPNGLVKGLAYETTKCLSDAIKMGCGRVKLFAEERIAAKVYLQSQQDRIEDLLVIGEKGGIIREPDENSPQDLQL